MVNIIEFDPSKDNALLAQVRDLHVETVEIDGAMMRYLPPFTDEKKARMLDFYNLKSDEVVRDLRHIFLALDDTNAKVIGVVMLNKRPSETGPFRGDVECLITSPNHRKQGIARKLMTRLEEIARKHDRTMIMLDTTVGMPAEHVYPRLGYIEVGRVPNYGYLPAKDCALADEVFFYKDLNKSAPL